MYGTARNEQEGPNLAAELQAFKQFLVLLKIVPFDIIEKFPTTAGHGDQAAAAMEILAVCPQVLGQVGDALREQGNLDFRRACVRVVNFEIRDDG